MGRYVDDIFVLFNKSSDHLKRFQSYLNSCYVNMSFAVKTEQNNKISFLDVNVIREQGKFITSVYRKPTFSGVYIHFDSFLPDAFKIGMIYTLVNRCVRICSSWSIVPSTIDTFKRDISEKMAIQKTSLIDVLSCS